MTPVFSINEAAAMIGVCFFLLTLPIALILILPGRRNEEVHTGENIPGHADGSLQSNCMDAVGQENEGTDQEDHVLINDLHVDGANQDTDRPEEEGPIQLHRFTSREDAYSHGTIQGGHAEDPQNDSLAAPDDHHSLPSIRDEDRTENALPCDQCHLPHLTNLCDDIMNNNNRCVSCQA